MKLISWSVRTAGLNRQETMVGGAFPFIRINRMKSYARHVGKKLKGENDGKSVECHSIIRAPGGWGATFLQM